MASNSEKVLTAARSIFAKCDLVKIQNVFHLDSDENHLFLRYLGTGCRIKKEDLVVECEDILTRKYEPAEYIEALTVYDILSRYETPPAAKDEYINLVSLNSLTGAASAPDGRSMFARCSKELDHKKAELENALCALGGVPDGGKGDLSYKLCIFGDLNICVRFWDSDDEFDPEILFFPDTGILSFMKYETVWYCCCSLAARIIRQIDPQSPLARMDRPVKRSPKPL